MRQTPPRRHRQTILAPRKSEPAAAAGPAGPAWRAKQVRFQVQFSPPVRKAGLSVRLRARRISATRGASSKVVLVTGFAPFGGSRINTSEQISRIVDGATFGRFRVLALILPCAFYDAVAQLKHALRLLRPTFVVALGEALREAVTPERIAVNLDRARIPDNRGLQPLGTPSVADAPDRYCSQLPVDRIVRTLNRIGIPARPSEDAGSFVCNHLFFGLMHELSRSAPVHRTRGGFIHLPALRGSARLRLQRWVRRLRGSARFASCSGRGVPTGYH